MSSVRWKVGIDLAPAARRDSAPGTARLVEEQARALFKLDVPWQWVPVLSPAPNPLREEAAPWQPLISRSAKPSRHATVETGRLWRQAGCSLGFATAFFAPFIGPPVVANFFDANYFEPVDAWHRRNRRARHWWTLMLMRHSILRARALFILSNYGKQRMAAVMPRMSEKFIVTPCGIRPPGPPPAARPEWARALPDRFFLYVGSFSDNKNQRTLLHAWRILQERHPNAPGLLLIGPGPRPYLEEVIGPLHRALARPEEVVISGFTPESELNWAYAHAFGYLQPSFAEGFGMPVLEAMSCGLPTACSDSTSLPETAGGAALLFDPRSAESIVARVEQLWKDTSLRARLSAAGRERASQFTWEKNALLIADTIVTQLRLIS